MKHTLLLAFALILLANCQFKQKADLSYQTAPTLNTEQHYTYCFSISENHNIAEDNDVRGNRRVKKFEDSVSPEEYSTIIENSFELVADQSTSTFGIDVDKASYANCRRYVNNGALPPKDAVRLEEFINYFQYQYPQPQGKTPFSINTELAACPWNEDHQLVMIGLQGKIHEEEIGGVNNLVFLVDNSGSMDSDNKIGLVKTGLRNMVHSLSPEDRVAIVTYAGNAGLALASTACSDKSKIIHAIDNMQPGGSTNGAAGIELAYQIALDNKVENGNNRIILCTDGDFNVGVSSTEDLKKLISQKRKSGIFLSTCGFGSGNYKDNRMETLADNGNGVAYYIDSEKEAQRVFVTGLRSTLYTIAKDVKIQVEFDPSTVESYRLIGYENRVLRNEDFDNDDIDAGDIGSGHCVTALYEIVPAKAKNVTQTQPSNAKGIEQAALAGIKLRYKLPDSAKSELLERRVRSSEFREQMSDNLSWASALALYGMIIRQSSFCGNGTYADVRALTRNCSESFMDEDKKEFIDILNKCESLDQAIK
jgi:Ca-activated chloride channel family protein